MDINSDPALISQVQQRLNAWGWLSLNPDEGGAQEGVLDQPTMDAVLAFQTYVNEQYAQSGVQLTPVDLEQPNPTIGSDTLKFLMNDQGIEVLKPEA